MVAKGLPVCAGTIRPVARGLFFAGLVALSACGSKDPAPQSANVAPATKTGDAAVASNASGPTEAAGKPASPSEAVASQSSAKPKDESQDVLKWLQMTPEKAAKADPAPPPVRPAAPASASAAPTSATANAAVQAAASSSASNPSNAAAVSLPRQTSTLTLIPVSAPTTRTVALSEATSSTGNPGASAAQPAAGVTAAQTRPAPVASETPAPLVATAAPQATPLAAAPSPAASLRLLSREQPAFPREAIRGGITKGHVRVRLTVDSDGSVSHVEVIESQPRGTFDKAVTAAALRWKYAPISASMTAIADFDFHSDE